MSIINVNYTGTVFFVYNSFVDNYIKDVNEKKLYIRKGRSKDGKN